MIYKQQGTLPLEFLGPANFILSSIYDVIYDTPKNVRFVHI